MRNIDFEEAVKSMVESDLSELQKQWLSVILRKAAQGASNDWEIVAIGDALHALDGV